MIATRKIYWVHLLLLSFLVTLLSSCATVAKFDRQSFEQTIDAKVEALALMKKATEEYDLHQNEVEKITKVMQKLYEYDKRRTNNELSSKMWEVMVSEERNLAGGYFKRWREQGTLNAAFVTEAVALIEEGFDLLLDFESRKDKTEESTLGSLINAFISNL